MARERSDGEQKTTSEREREQRAREKLYLRRKPGAHWLGAHRRRLHAPWRAGAPGPIVSARETPSFPLSLDSAKAHPLSSGNSLRPSHESAIKCAQFRDSASTWPVSSCVPHFRTPPTFPLAKSSSSSRWIKALDPIKLTW